MAGRLGHAIHEGARRDLPGRGSRKDAEAQRVVLSGLAALRETNRWYWEVLIGELDRRLKRLPRFARNDKAWG